MAQKVKFTFTAINNTKAAFNQLNKSLSFAGKTAAVTSKAVLGIGAAATAAAGTIALFTKANVNALDTLGKTASKLGVNVEFLQQMRFAAEQTGIETRTLDMGLQRFIRRVAEAAKGTGEAKGALQQLGIEFKNADGSARDIQDILFDVADGLANTSSEGERVRLAFKFFDSEGVALVNTLKGGSAELKKFFDEAENLGILISSDTTKKAEAFNDQLNIIKRQFTAITQNLVGAFLPVLQDLSKDLTEFLTKTKSEAGGFDKLGIKIAVGIVNGVKSLVLGIANFLDSMNNFITDITMSLKTVQYGLIETKLKTLEVRQSLFGLFKDFGLEIIDSKLKIMELSGEVVDLGNKSSTTFIDMANLTGDALDKVIEKLQKTKEAQDNLTGNNGGDNDTPTTPLLVGMEDFKNSIGATDEALGKLGVSSMKKFEDSIVEGLKNGKLAFKDFANYVIEQLLRIAIQEAILKPMTSGFSDFFSGIFGRASGGPVNSNTPYIVGERGPELFVPSGNGNIVPNNQMGGQSAPTVNFNISTVDAAGFDQLLASRKGLITSIINNAMNNQGKMGVV
jgi:TP901 family phage tail tape measure protein